MKQVTTILLLVLFIFPFATQAETVSTSTAQGAMSRPTRIAQAQVECRAYVVEPTSLIDLFPGDLVKLSDDCVASISVKSAVYYIGADKKRYVFPNEKIYKSWYQDFSNIKSISAESLAAIPVGGAVTYRAGSRLLKYPSDSKVYLVTRGGILRWAQNEDVVRNWYGPLWRSFVDDLSEAFAVQYQFGPSIQSYTEIQLAEVVAEAGSSIDADKGLSK